MSTNTILGVQLTSQTAVIFAACVAGAVAVIVALLNLIATLRGQRVSQLLALDERRSKRIDTSYVGVLTWSYEVREYFGYFMVDANSTMQKHVMNGDQPPRMNPSVRAGAEAFGTSGIRQMLKDLDETLDSIWDLTKYIVDRRIDIEKVGGDAGADSNIQEAEQQLASFLHEVQKDMFERLRGMVTTELDRLGEYPRVVG